MSGLSFPSPKKGKYYVTYSVECKKKKKKADIKIKSRKVMVKGWRIEGNMERLIQGYNSVIR